ncbi:FadR/GntR family transcriptional regulator [Cellulomonas persica]|uniref:Transcriptional regulator n=1 Tax=Cellulomonas persica TaxID=76861 RepID=A0A510UVW5_9CELL|nr:FadR/GntR family transcriptional regulator [Cellulomonas persica]GEK18709.1 transcriptional regulator [Cellulomonas persica]
MVDTTAAAATGRAHARVAPSRSSATAAQIKELILTRNLHPGDPLPTENELCDLLGVSRSSVREAVRTLTTLGIAEVRHGHGTFVGQMSLDALVETLVFRGALLPGDDLKALREIIEIREALDLAMAERLADAVRGTSNPELWRLVESMEASSDRGETFAEADRQFHTALLATMGNSIVGPLVGAFWDVHTAVMPRLGVGLPDDLAQTAHAHREMLEAAEAGDVAAYQAAVHRHYAPLARALGTSAGA